MAFDDDLDYCSLSEFRYQIRKFLRFSEEASRARGLNGQQHQLLLALKGLPPGAKPTVGILAERLQLRHHSTVGLLDRLEERGYIARKADPDDRRQVLVRITPAGAAILRKLTRRHREELHAAGPALIATLRNVLS